MTSSTTTTTTLRLHPWRDGIDYCLQQLKDAYDQENSDYENEHYQRKTAITRRKAARPAVVVSSIRNGQFTFHNDSAVAPNHHHTLKTRRRVIQTVDICFEMGDLLRASRRYDNDTTLVQEQWTILMDTIAFLPDLTSFLMRLIVPGNKNVMEDDKDGIQKDHPWLLPSFASITNLLANATSLEYFTLMGIPLATSASNEAYDMNGFLETLRIHPSLVSVAIQNCTFGSLNQMTRLQEILQERSLGKDKEVVEVVETNRLETAVPDLSSSWWQRCCLFFW